MCNVRGSSRVVLSAVAILFLAGGRAGADMIFSTLGDGDSYDTGGGWQIGKFFDFPGFDNICAG